MEGFAPFGKALIAPLPVSSAQSIVPHLLKSSLHRIETSLVLESSARWFDHAS